MTVLRRPRPAKRAHRPTCYAARRFWLEVIQKNPLPAGEGLGEGEGSNIRRRRIIQTPLTLVLSRKGRGNESKTQPIKFDFLDYADLVCSHNREMLCAKSAPEYQ